MKDMVNLNSVHGMSVAAEELSPSIVTHAASPESASCGSFSSVYSLSISPVPVSDPIISPSTPAAQMPTNHRSNGQTTSSPTSLQFLSFKTSDHSTSSVVTESASFLPPCRICLDKASGFHYGLNTCEACKGFFRRSLKRAASYVCIRDGACDVTGERRNLCGYCRYQKCIVLGMSKQAIKTGRYTHAKRTKDTLEIQEMLKPPVDTKRESEIDFEDLVMKVVKAHDEYVISSTRVPLSFIAEQQKQRLEELRLQQETFGKMISISQDEHKEIFDLTGIDVDNRRELMNFHVKNSERWIRGYISFAKHLPGFRALTLTDQANLVKFARIEFWFLGSFPGYNSELGVAMMPNGRCFTREEMYTVWRHRYIDIAFDLARSLQKLKITPEEMILVKAVCLTFGDRCKMEEPEKVEHVQWTMIRCLLHLLKNNQSSHTSAMLIFAQIINCLTGLRDLNEAEYQTIRNTMLYDVFQTNPLIMEVLPY